MAKNLVDQMKERIAKSGSSKKEILYWAKDAKKRIRFLQELDSGFMFQFHNDFNAKLFELCHDQENHEECKLCEEGIPLQDNFVFSVWDYDSNSVRLIQFKATGVSPIPSLIEMYEEFGTIMDRDYNIKKVGQGQGSSYVVTPLDKEKFRNNKAKPFTRDQVQEILEKAWASSESDDEDDEDEEGDEPKKGKKSKGKEKKVKDKKKKKEPTLREKLEKLDLDTLKMIAQELGMSKKELKGLDEDEIIDELFDNYEEEDIKDIYEEEDDSFEDDEDEEGD